PLCSNITNSGGNVKSNYLRFLNDITNHQSLVSSSISNSGIGYRTPSPTLLKNHLQRKDNETKTIQRKGCGKENKLPRLFCSSSPNSVISVKSVFRRVLNDITNRQHSVISPPSNTSVKYKGIDHRTPTSTLPIDHQYMKEKENLSILTNESGTTTHRKYQSIVNHFAMKPLRD
ncbi:hypothetical protein CARUB_v10007248mg, partial [Capsella rubella]